MTIELNNGSQRSPNTLRVWGIAVLLVVTLIWGTSYPLLKGVVSSLSPPAIFATRFAVAALPFTPYLRFLNLPLLRDGVFLGLIILSTLTLQTVALETTSANRAAFIASFNVNSLRSNSKYALRARFAIKIQSSKLKTNQWGQGSATDLRPLKTGFSVGALTLIN